MVMTKGDGCLDARRNEQAKWEEQLPNQIKREMENRTTRESRVSLLAERERE